MMKHLLLFGLALFSSAQAPAEFTLYEANGSIVRMKGRLDIRAAHTQGQTELFEDDCIGVGMRYAF